MHPLLLISASVVLSSTSQVLFKVATGGGEQGGVGLSASLFTSWALWAGIVATLTSLVSWLNALRSLPLLVAFNLSAATYILVPIGCWWFLGEQVPPIRWLGIALVTAGVLVIARPLARMEDRL